jgi:ubiquinone/menaquinone biosynthesis C-methylase UbiE
MSTSAAPSHAGQAIYTPLTLALYDVAVLGISNRLIWRCPTRRILQLYDEHVTSNHLDVGVGTGWYLDHCTFSDPDVRLGLMDLNPSSLRKAAARLQRYSPELYQADVLEPIGIEATPFRSVSLSYLLHCLPGSLCQKAVAFDHLRTLLEPGGKLFGATLLARGVERSGTAHAVMRLYNAKGIFSNEEDSLEELQRELNRRFEQVTVQVVGCAALFAAVA